MYGQLHAAPSGVVFHCQKPVPREKLIGLFESLEEMEALAEGLAQENKLDEIFQTKRDIEAMPELFTDRWLMRTFALLRMIEADAMKEISTWLDGAAA